MALRILAVVLLAGCGLPELDSETVFGRDKNPKAWAYGTVVDANTRGPIEGVTVQLARGTEVTDANGAFRFESVAVGDGEFAVSKAGYQTLGQYYRLHAGGNRVEISLAPLNCGCTNGKVCELTTRACVDPARISGIITDACNGGPLIAKITVSGISGCTDSGPKGIWEIGGLIPGGPQTLAAGRGGYQPFSTQVTLVSGFNALEQIKLTPIGGCGAVPPSWSCQ